MRATYVQCGQTSAEPQGVWRWRMADFAAKAVHAPAPKHRGLTPPLESIANTAASLRREMLQWQVKT